MRLLYELKLIRQAFLRHQISVLPKGHIKERIKVGRRVREVYISNYRGVPNCKSSRYSINSSKGRYFLELIKKRQSLESELQRLESEIDLPDFGSINIWNVPPEAEENWKRIKAVEDTNTRYPKPTNGPVYKGIIYRSKSEMTIAKVLDELEIPYAYEPTIMFGTRQFNPDFAVYIKETGKVFFIEHFGKMGYMDYRKDNFDKFSFFMDSGLKVGKDIHFFFEKADAGIEEEVFVQQICAMVMVEIMSFINRK